MIAYLDTSVVVRLLFQEPNPLAQWEEVTQPYSSVLIQIELNRVIDRARLSGKIDDKQLSKLVTTAQNILARINLIAIDERIVARAAAPMRTVVKSLDAIHLATAMLVAQDFSRMVLATHDDRLALAASANGLKVIGSPAIN